MQGSPNPFGQPAGISMPAGFSFSSIYNLITSVFVTLSNLAIFWAKILCAIGVFYLVAKGFSFPTFPILGFSVPYPRVTIDATQLLYACGAIWLITR